MSIKAYDSIPNSVLDEVHTTQDGKTYTIRCDEKLVVDMNFTGKDQTTSNSQGWERNSTKYFQQLQQNHPEMFSTKNTVRIQNGQAPIVDNKMISQNPQYAQFKGEPLVHHHIGGDGQAAAVPRSMHKGFGEIHNHEKNAGITQNCKDFSQKCDAYIQNNPNMQGKNASEMSNLVGVNQNQSSGKSSANVQHGATSQTPQAATTKGTTNNIQTAQTSSRSSAVKSVLDSQNVHGSSQGQGRAQSVNGVLSGHSASGQSSGSSQSHSATSGQSSAGGQSSSGSQSSSSSQSSSGGQSSSDGQSSSGGQSR